MAEAPNNGSYLPYGMPTILIDQNLNLRRITYINFIYFQCHINFIYTVIFSILIAHSINVTRYHTDSSFLYHHDENISLPNLTYKHIYVGRIQLLIKVSTPLIRNTS